LEYGNFDRDIDEIHISSIMRYPVAERLAIVRQELPAATLLAPYSVRLTVDAAERVTYAGNWRRNNCLKG